MYRYFTLDSSTELHTPTTDYAITEFRDRLYHVLCLDTSSLGIYVTLDYEWICYTINIENSCFIEPVGACATIHSTADCSLYSVQCLRGRHLKMNMGAGAELQNFFLAYTQYVFLVKTQSLHVELTRKRPRPFPIKGIKAKLPAKLRPQEPTWSCCSASGRRSRSLVDGSRRAQCFQTHIVNGIWERASSSSGSVVTRLRRAGHFDVTLHLTV